MLSNHQNGRGYPTGQEQEFSHSSYPQQEYKTRSNQMPNQNYEWEGNQQGAQHSYPYSKPYYQDEQGFYGQSEIYYGNQYDTEEEYLKNWDEPMRSGKQDAQFRNAEQQISSSYYDASQPYRQATGQSAYKRPSNNIKMPSQNMRNAEFSNNDQFHRFKSNHQNSQSASASVPNYTYQKESYNPNELPRAWQEMMIDSHSDKRSSHVLSKKEQKEKTSFWKWAGKSLALVSLATLTGMSLYCATHMFFAPVFADEKTSEMVQSPIDYLKKDILKVYQEKLDADAKAQAEAEAQAEQERIAQEEAEALAQQEAEEAQRLAEEQARIEEEQQMQAAQFSAESQSEVSTWSGSVLTASAGVNQGPSGRETYYNLPMEGVISIMRSMGNNDPYWVREDGVKMLGDYVMVAANLNVHPRGSLVESSLGMGIVCDTGGFAYNNPNQLDIATSW